MKQRQNADHPWLENYEYESDQTVYDIAHRLWSYRMKDADAIPVLSVIKGKKRRIARSDVPVASVRD